LIQLVEFSLALQPNSPFKNESAFFMPCSFIKFAKFDVVSKYRRLQFATFKIKTMQFAFRRLNAMYANTSRNLAD
jgi:hypothetical protein